MKRYADLDKDLSRVVDSIADAGMDRIFDDIETRRMKEGWAPSDVKVVLEWSYGFGEYWEDWWRESGEEWY